MTTLSELHLLSCIQPQHCRHLSAEKVLKEVKNYNTARHDEGRVLQGLSEWCVAFPQIAHMRFANSGPTDRSYCMLEGLAWGAFANWEDVDKTSANAPNTVFVRCNSHQCQDAFVLLRSKLCIQCLIGPTPMVSWPTVNFLTCKWQLHMCNSWHNSKKFFSEIILFWGSPPFYNIDIMSIKTQIFCIVGPVLTRLIHS